jgi:hypothetical protein
LKAGTGAGGGVGSLAGVSTGVATGAAITAAAAADGVVVTEVDCFTGAGWLDTFGLLPVTGAGDGVAAGAGAVVGWVTLAEVVADVEAPRTSLGASDFPRITPPTIVRATKLLNRINGNLCIETKLVEAVLLPMVISKLT